MGEEEKKIVLKYIQGIGSVGIRLPPIPEEPPNSRAPVKPSPMPRTAWNAPEEARVQACIIQFPTRMLCLCLIDKKKKITSFEGTRDENRCSYIYAVYGCCEPIRKAAGREPRCMNAKTLEGLTQSRTFPWT
jgi:hypothetical protein